MDLQFTCTYMGMKLVLLLLKIDMKPCIHFIKAIEAILFAT